MRANCEYIACNDIFARKSVPFITELCRNLEDADAVGSTLSQVTPDLTSSSLLTVFSLIPDVESSICWFFFCTVTHLLVCLNSEHPKWLRRNIEYFAWSLDLRVALIRWGVTDRLTHWRWDDKGHLALLAKCNVCIENELPLLMLETHCLCAHCQGGLSCARFRSFLFGKIR